MAIDYKDFKENEESMKEHIFQRISDICARQAENTIIIEKTGKEMEYEVGNIPNIGITLNNKLMELSKQFHNVGTSMFVRYEKEIDATIPSFIGESIIEDLIEYLEQAVEQLEEYSKEVKKVANRKTEDCKAITQVSPVQKFLAKIKSFFIPAKPIDTSLKQEEKEALNMHLEEYRNIDDTIWKYNLEDNVVSSIVKNINKVYSVLHVPSVLKKEVVPELEKLGLSHLIPKLQTAIIEEHRKNLSDLEVAKIDEEDLYLDVPEFNKEAQEGKELTKEDIEELTEQANVLITKGQELNREVPQDSLKKVGKEFLDPDEDRE